MKQLLIEVELLEQKGNARVDSDLKRLVVIHTQFGLLPRYKGNRCGGCLNRAFKQIKEYINSHPDNETET